MPHDTRDWVSYRTATPEPITREHVYLADVVTSHAGYLSQPRSYSYPIPNSEKRTNWFAFAETVQHCSNPHQFQ